MIKRKIKFILWHISLSLIALITAGTLFAYDSIVTGQNNPGLDVKAVQEAVDKGGSVLLKGTFNFGKKGQVNIKNDIQVTGEKDDQGRYLTKIIGGFWTFHSPLSTTELPPPNPGPKLKIANIHFDGATWTPMHFSYTSGAEITGNKVTNVQPFPVTYKWPGGENLLFTAGVVLGNRYAHKEKVVPGAVTGNLIVKDNQIDLKCKNPEITEGQGVFFPWTWGASIQILRNKIRNVSRNSIESLDNYLDEAGKGSVLIAENNIVTPKNGIPFPSPSTPNGIVAGWFFDMTGGSDPSRISKITIIRNFIQTNGETSSGMITLTNGVAVLGNRIEVNGGKESSGVTHVGSNSFFSRNKIDGSGAFAMRAVPYKDIKSNGNIFSWNDVKEFKAAAADVLYIGNKNTLIGASCKVVDKGKDNMILVY